MNQVYNFSPGPSMLPKAVMEKAQQELINWHDTGMSVAEISHRSTDFLDIAEQSRQNLKELLQIPKNYQILFMHGGATSQFSAIPLNLSSKQGQADYIITGQWGVKAEKEARKFTQSNILIDTSEQLCVPKPDQYQINSNSDYLHYTPNETIVGVEFPFIPPNEGLPLIADMSSTILSRPIDVSQYALIYAGAQKNISISGLCLVIIRDDLLEKSKQQTNQIPSLLNYQHIADTESMSNTPNTFAWYLANEVFKWLLEQGGLEAMAHINKRKSSKLYAYIDRSDFYNNPVEIHSRSWMNIPFTLADDSLNSLFLEQAATEGLTNLKGHRVIGGMRASIYNAMPEEGVDALLSFMHHFVRKHG